jgi:TRAP-type mannitol/chloroaromatic compound transport system permease small subunit
MIKFIRFIDLLSAWVGKAFGWCILIMTIGVGYEVIVRYLLRDPTSWSFDMTYMMYGALFMMAGAYTLSRDGHVRGDVVYRLWPPRVQAVIEIILYFIFFFPGILALIFAGWDYAMESWSYNNGRGEVSVMSPAGVPISQLKTVLPAAGLLLFVQGIGQVCRCIVCMRTGQWPQQVEDVEEMETMLLHAAEDEAQTKAALGIAITPEAKSDDEPTGTPEGDRGGDKA